MANIVGTLRDHRSDKLSMDQAITRIAFLDGEVARSVAVGTIRPLAVLPAGTAGNAGSFTPRYAKNTGVPGGRRLLVVGGFGTYFERSNTAASASRTLIESYLTDAGDMDGVIINPMTSVFLRVSAKRDGTAPFGEEARIEIDIINNKAAGGDDLLANVETDRLSSGFVTRVAQTSGISVAFATDDQLQVDFYIQNEGIPP